MSNNEKSKWWRWPEKAENDLVPWFVILRRGIFWIPLAASLFVCFILIYLSYGHEYSRDWLTRTLQ